MVRHHQRIGQPLAVELQDRNDSGEPAKPVEAMGAPRFAKGAAVHGMLDSYVKRKKIGASSIGSGAVLGASLAENSEVAGDGKVAGHSDFLPAANAHPVYAADHRLIALQNRGNHVVKKA